MFATILVTLKVPRVSKKSNSFYMSCILRFILRTTKIKRHRHMNISNNDLKMSSLQLKTIVPIPIPSLLLHFPSLVTWGEWKEYIRHSKKNICIQNETLGGGLGGGWSHSFINVDNIIPVVSVIVQYDAYCFRSTILSSLISTTSVYTLQSINI